MKKIAVFEAEIDDSIISEKQVREHCDGDWLEAIKVLYEDDPYGIFDIKLVAIKDAEED